VRQQLNPSLLQHLRPHLVLQVVQRTAHVCVKTLAKVYRGIPKGALRLHASMLVNAPLGTNIITRRVIAITIFIVHVFTITEYTRLETS